MFNTTLSRMYLPCVCICRCFASFFHMQMEAASVLKCFTTELALPGCQLFVNTFDVFDHVALLSEGGVALLAAKQHWHGMISHVCLEHTFSDTLVAVQTPDNTLYVQSHVDVYVAGVSHLYP